MRNKRGQRIGGQVAPTLTQLVNVMATDRCDEPRLERIGIAHVHQHATAGRALEQRDELEHRALAGAGAAGEEHHLAAVDAEADVGEGLAPVGVAFAHPVESDHALPGPSTSAAAKAAASNSPKSSGAWPTPMKRIGIESSRAMAITMPPRAVPSSLVIASPVTPTASLN